MEAAKELYYYTTSDTMRYILTKGDIYATNLKYMNDGEEYTNGLTELKTVLNKKYEGRAKIRQEDFEEEINQQPKIYSISFSRERDLLSQWSMYAKESGISIRMDFSGDKVNEEYYEIPFNGPENKAKKQASMPYKVYYLTKHVMDPEEYDRAYEEIICDLEGEKTVVPSAMLQDIQDGIHGVWQLLAPYVKRKEFFQESEYRMIFSLNSMEAGTAEGDSSIRVDYRVQDCVLKPYLDVTRAGGWPVKEIMVGPGFNQKAVYESVKHFCDNARIMIPSYSAEEIKENASFFLKRLDLDGRLGGAIGLEKEWESMSVTFRNDMGAVQAFNQFIKRQCRKLGAEGNLLENVCMCRGGVILSISETPYIY